MEKVLLNSILCCFPQLSFNEIPNNIQMFVTLNSRHVFKDYSFAAMELVATYSEKMAFKMLCHLPYHGLL